MKKIFYLIFVISALFISVNAFSATWVKQIVVNTPGTLYKVCKMDFDGVSTDSEYGEEVWDDVKTLKIIGTIDARDFSTLKWNLRGVETIDLSEVTVSPYSGKYGTNEGYFYEGNEYSTYASNEIPIGAFFYWMHNEIREFPSEFYDEGNHIIKKVTLPTGITTIARNAFARNYNLEEVNIPEGVTTIGMVAFRYCTSIKVINLPTTIKEIGWLAFTDMYSLDEVHIRSVTPPSMNDSFGNYPDSDNRGSVVVDSPGYSKNTGATLYVPKGCKDKYADWSPYFKNIVEE